MPEADDQTLYEGGEVPDWFCTNCGEGYDPCDSPGAEEADRYGAVVCPYCEHVDFP